MDFTTAVRTCLRKYATFSGRAQRSEFWWFWLFGAVVGTVASILDLMVFGSGPGAREWLSSLAGLALFLPLISAGVRRLHDTGRSGWWWWLNMIPIIGWIVLIVWYCQKSEPGANRFGPDPLGRTVVPAPVTAPGQ